MNMPPCFNADSRRRPVELYRQYCINQTLSDYICVCEGLCVSRLKELSLTDYVQARRDYCILYHEQTCTNCNNMIKAAQMILSRGICDISEVFRHAFPDSTYCSSSAKSRLLQMPVMAVRIGSPSSGTSVLKVIELHPHVDPKMIQLYLNSMKSMFSSTSSVSSPPMQKEHFKEVLAFAQSQREREVLSYAVFKASGMSASRARKHFGLENIAHRATNVDKAICEAKAIRKCIDSLATTQEVALLQSYGIPYENPDSDISSEGEHSDEDLSTEHASLELPPLEKISVMLKESLFNWFDVVEKLEHICQLDDTEDSFVDQLQHVYSMLVSSSNLKFEENEMFLMQQSYCAYTNERLIRVNTCQQQVDELNGMIVEENVTLDPEEYIGVDDLSNDVTKKLITKRRIAIQRHARYLKAKKIAENNFLARKSSSHTRGILKDYPDIGQTIEDFVQSQNIGADAWRRTGVLTFDGNTRVGKRVTFERIRQHLESKYNRKFSYGTTVQLCVARNKRRQSAKNYRGVAHVTSRRARKGFTLKFNPDSHWSNALYRGLSMIQYTDGSNIININRDDAAGFRLDTMTTHRLHKTLQVQGKDTQTTHTDFVNKYPSTLQTTSYNFSKTATTEEVCVGIVKASGVYPKNPAQHLSDLEMIEKSELQSPFINPLTEERKQIECVRVDGASDEGPSHEEIQFYWTERHYNNGYAVTLITTRSSGSSYLNRVELQNGCMAVAHANLFIPSTLAGTNMSTETGKLDREKFTTNMDLATDVYLNRVNGCPCGATTISLLKGADSSDSRP